MAFSRQFLSTTSNFPTIFPSHFPISVCSTFSRLAFQTKLIKTLRKKFPINCSSPFRGEGGKWETFKATFFARFQAFEVEK
jgi:hypothetical protein